MKKVLVALLATSLLAIGVGCTSKANKTRALASVDTVEYVYICTGPYASTYHYCDDCKGLNSCKAKVEKVTLEKAKKIGRRPCRICY